MVIADIAENNLIELLKEFALKNRIFIGHVHCKDGKSSTDSLELEDPSLFSLGKFFTSNLTENLNRCESFARFS